MLTHQLLRNTSNNRRIIMPEIISMLWLFCWSNNIQCTIVESLYTLNFGVQPVLTEALFPCSMGNSNYSVTFRTFFKSGAGSCSLEITYLHSWKGKVIQLSLNSCLGVGYSLDFFFFSFFFWYRNAKHIRNRLNRAETKGKCWDSWIILIPECGTVTHYINT